MTESSGYSVSTMSKIAKDLSGMTPKITFNKRLIWDYDISERDLAQEDIFIFYLSRVLNNGTLDDILGVPAPVIEKYLNRLHLSKKIRKFWEWYLGNGR